MKLIATIAAAILAATAFIVPASAADVSGARGHSNGSFEIARPHSCVAVALRRGGRGGVVPGTRNVAYGRAACARATHACRIDLRRRQYHGHNPYASCVVVRGHRHWG